MSNRRTPQLLLILLLFTSLPDNRGMAAVAAAATADGEQAPTPARWPEQFHALLYTNLSNFGQIRVDDLWYDWPNGRSVLIMQQQLWEELLYDVEWDNGTSFYYTLGNRTCRRMRFPVGIVRPDFLEGSTYLGRTRADGFLCHLWQKADFIWYYQDVATGRPVRWDFYDGISMHVMRFEVGAVLADPRCWQAPAYCFDGSGDNRSSSGGREAEEGGLAELHRRLSLLGRHGELPDGHTPHSGHVI